MKNTAAVIVITMFIFSCNQSSNSEVKNAKDNLTEARNELADAQSNEMEASKEKTVAEWDYFKTESDSTIASIENDLKELEVKVEKANKKDKQKLNESYSTAKRDLAVLKEKLHYKNLAFENELKTLDKNAYKKNESFKHEFKHDLVELSHSIKDLTESKVMKASQEQ